jgi:hypothetical protein
MPNYQVPAEDRLGDTSTRQMMTDTSPPPIPAKSPLRNPLPAAAYGAPHKQQESDREGCRAEQCYQQLEQQIDDTLREFNACWPYQPSETASILTRSSCSRASSRSRYSTANSISTRSSSHSKSSSSSYTWHRKSVTSATSTAQLTTGSSRSDCSSWWDEYAISRRPSSEDQEIFSSPEMTEPEVSTEQIFDLVCEMPSIRYEDTKGHRKPELLFPPHPAVRPMSAVQAPMPTQMNPDTRAAALPMVSRSASEEHSYAGQSRKREINSNALLRLIPRRTSSRRYRF